MILSAHEILARLGGDIQITPFDKKQLNPNSYNLRLGHDLVVYDELIIDIKREHRIKKIKIPESGFTLQPNEIYLAQTLEFTETNNLVPMIEGRSSGARLGLTVHMSAGFGDIGFCGHWTLELSVVKPLVVYSMMEICQIFYNTVHGKIDRTYAGGKYQNNDGIQPSKFYEEYR